MSVHETGGRVERAQPRDQSKDEDVGLTKPLYNNVGGVIDQDAPSADQLLDKSGSESTWGTASVERGSAEGDRRDHNADRSGLIPDIGERFTTPRDR